MVTEDTAFDWKIMTSQQKAEYLDSAVTDCSFVVGSEPDGRRTLKSYKAILASASPVFERMFNGEFLESHSPEGIVVTDANPDDFEMFLNYITHGEKACGLPNIRSLEIEIALFCLAKKYAIGAMQISFKRSMLKDAPYRSPYGTLVFNASSSDYKEPCCILVRGLAMAVQHEDADLLKKFTELIAYKEKEYKPLWGAYIYDLDEASFVKWIRCLLTRHSEKFNYIETYAKFHGLKRKPFQQGFFADVLGLVDFSSMNVNEFRDGPASSDILTPKEKMTTFLFLNGKAITK